MYFEVFKQGNLIVRGKGKQILNPITLDNELMLAPSTTLTLPIDWLDVIDGREEIKLHLDECRVFWGIVWGIEADKRSETVELDVRHVVTEWQYRQISVNHAISDNGTNSSKGRLNIVYKGDKLHKSTENNETITANDFTVVKSKIDDMSTADWVKKAGAVAWNPSNGDAVKVTKADISDIDKEDGKWKEGSYKVEFSTAKGTSVTVNVEVVSSVELQSRRTKSDKANNETISAVPFKVYQGKNLTIAQVKKKADPKAWVYRHKSQEVDVTSVTTDFKNEVGIYELTARTAKGTSITVKIEVVSGDDYSTLDDPAVVDQLEDIYNDMNFAYPGWQIDFQDDSGDEMIDYVYSRQNKLDALTETMELTDDLWWRVGLWNEKRIEIGKFGEKKPYTLSTKPSGNSNIRIIDEPVLTYDFENVVNVATVYSDKSDGGMSSLTLREAYMDEELLEKEIIDKRIQKDGFPVVILHSNANNERDYSKYISQYPKLAPNNELEYAVIDEESVALESGIVIEGTYAFNDLSPFEVDGKRISDKKRARAARSVYNAVVKKLIQARRNHSVTMTTEPIPCDLEVGDRIRFIYNNKIWHLEACSNYWKKVLSINDWWYITAVSYNYDEYGNLTNEITLSKWLKIERETANHE